MEETCSGLWAAEPLDFASIALILKTSFPSMVQVTELLLKEVM